MSPASFQVVEPGSFSEAIWDEKYRLKRGNEPVDQTIDDTWKRVALAIAEVEEPKSRDRWAAEFFDAMSEFEFLPAGRIIAGAGTSRDVTCSNCYVMGDIADSLDGIMEACKESALTLKQGGGIGMAFSTLRPRGAIVKGVDSTSSGAVSFMKIWHQMCGTIMSAGSRRGAMMGTLRVDHPDIEEFIEVKQTPGELTNFNISVLVTDAFMAAVAADTKWELHFKGTTYRTVQARALWEKILRATYEFAEPGVIFIDHMNNSNPLKSIETFSATNPCGEMPLPPYGACVLGSVNLARLVDKPFTDRASLDWERLRALTRIGVRFLDNVVSISNYPLAAQKQEAESKRRIGIGITGLANALVMLGIPYRHGSQITAEITQQMRESATDASTALAGVRGHYPAWEKDHGPKRRNSHLMSIAPTGTISCFAGNVSSGIEPVFDYDYSRNVLMPDGSKKLMRCTDYAARMHRALGYDQNMSVWVTATEVSPEDHVSVAAAAQRHVDSAVSKTINCPPEMTFDEFSSVYDLAHKAGMKGCTTYRPSGVRGAVLIKDEPKKEPTAAAAAVCPQELKPESNVVRLTEPLARPQAISGRTYKIRPGENAAFYVTINDVAVNGQLRPFEIFFNTKSAEAYGWMTALSRMISAVFRAGGDVSFVVDELMSVFEPNGGFWSEGKYVPSISAAIGAVIRQHLDELGGSASSVAEEPPAAMPDKGLSALPRHLCPKCSSGLHRQEGCWSCQSCSYSKCA